MRAVRPPSAPPAWRALSVCALAGAAAHIGPAGTWLPPVRRSLFPALDGRGRPGHIALTFDDGPARHSTPYFLDTLDRLAVRATFFVLGRALLEAPDTGRELVARGHEVAVHGWDHRRPWWPTPLRDLSELRRTVAAVGAVCGVRPRWYRPPYGVLTGGRWAAARRVGLRPVLWSAWGREWVSGATARSVADRVGRGLHGGGTVLLHDTDRASGADSWRVALQALPELVECCRRQGFTIGPLRDHGIGVENARPGGQEQTGRLC
ncbi:polysaccharide deacetylase family protein [Streptomyces silvisoli]|uniref:polysaccharide deacetylase family protein n=1 Tax=Streptomyces silvisoli TaxID=3034235 RepID=UPI0037041B97